MTLRQRILFALVPLVGLLALIGAIGIVLLHRVGDHIKDILRENYVSVVAMLDLNEALEGIDSSFPFDLHGEAAARQTYERSWSLYRQHLEIEERNITVPGEGELVERLKILTEEYRRRGEDFFAAGPIQGVREEKYYGAKQRGLLQCFRDIKTVARAIRELNQRNMEQASSKALHTATVSEIWLIVALAVTTLLAGLLIWSTTRSILRPIQAVTQSAIAIGAGNLNQVVPVVSHDEMGQLAEAFNRMSRQLRGYRDSHSAHLLRVQRTSQATIDSFPDPVLVLDPNGRVEMANPAAHRLLGITPPPPGQTPTYNWVPPSALRQPLDDALHKQRPFLTQAFDQTVTFRYDGEDRAYLPQVLPIQDPFGSTLGAALVLNDVTRFRLLDQIKSDLVATVSHELKTPLTSVRLVLHLLLEETIGPLTPKQAELLIDARDNAERLLNMIEHLLALARLEEGRESLQFQPETPQALLQAAAEAARPRAEAKHVELIVEEASQVPAVAADPVRLGHALNNLLDNALTYTDQGGRITLSARALDDQTVQLSVSDTGVGIAAEHLPHVFDKFFRVAEQSRGHGTGLGLAIVQEIALAHRGQIRCESQSGQGTVFHLTLPVWKQTRV
jgi:two-component system, NtrC family, sensor histidine kinase KinB